METQWIILILAGVIVFLVSSYSARGARIKQLEAQLVHLQAGIEALRRDMNPQVWQTVPQTRFQQNAPSFANGGHLPEMRMLPESQRSERNVLEEIAGAGFLLLLIAAVILIGSGG